jgi:hypothetical protein
LVFLPPSFGFFFAVVFSADVGGGLVRVWSRTAPVLEQPGNSPATAVESNTGGDLSGSAEKFLTVKPFLEDLAVLVGLIGAF